MTLRILRSAPDELKLRRLEAGKYVLIIEGNGSDSTKFGRRSALFRWQDCRLFVHQNHVIRVRQTVR